MIAVSRLPARIIGASVLALGLIGLGGCTTVVAPVEPQAILVQPERHVLLLHANARGGFSGADHRRLSSFLIAASEQKLDALHVVITSPNASARAHIARHARRTGVSISKIREVAGFADEGSRFGVRVEAIRFVAIPPVCPALEITGPSWNNNDFERTLGCSTRANLAAEANDPADLLRNGARPASDGDRAALPVSRWRSGQPAPATQGGSTGGRTTD